MSVLLYIQTCTIRVFGKDALHLQHTCTTRHTLKVTRSLLLELYGHTLEVRLWNTRDRVAARARFDRPKAFRLPVPKRDEEGEGGGRPAKFPVVGQERERVSRAGRRKGRKRASSMSVVSEGESDLDLSSSIGMCVHGGREGGEERGAKRFEGRRREGRGR